MASRAEILITAQDRTNGAFRSVERSMGGLRTASLALTTAISGIVAGFGLRELGEMADSYQNIQARLKLATRDAEEFAEANANIKRIAETSKNPLEATATLYTRISQSLLDVGGTQQQVASTTQALALALRLSGATAGESASAMLQFSQAIGSGVLRGEEFNAVNEAAPRAMKALADALGVPIGALREMAKEGKITRDILVDALGSQLPTLLAEAETLPNTIGVAFTDARNEVLLTVGAIDKITGASGGAAKAVEYLADGLRNLRNIIAPSEDLQIAKRLDYLRDSIDSILLRRRLLSGAGIDSSNFWAKELENLNAEAIALQKNLAKIQDAAVVPQVDGGEDPAAKLKRTLADAKAAAEAEAARKRLEAAAKATASADKSAIQSLRSRLLTTRELSEVEQAAEEIRAGRYKDLSASAKQQLLILAAQIDSQKALNQAEEDQAAIQKRNTEEGIARFKSLQDAGARVFAATRTDAERYSEEIEHLNVLLAQGAISQETYNRAVAAAQDEFQKVTDKAKDASNEMSQFSLQAARNMQSHFANFLFDPFEKGINGMLAGFVDVLRRMAAEAAAAQIFNSLFGKGEGDSGLLGGVFNSAISSMFGGVKKFASGGMHSGGLRLVGEQGPELEMTGPSRIFNANETRSMLSGGGGDNITLNLTIQTGVQQTVRAEFISMVPAIQKKVIEAVANAKARGGRMGNSL